MVPTTLAAPSAASSLRDLATAGELRRRQLRRSPQVAFEAFGVVLPLVWERHAVHSRDARVTAAARRDLLPRARCANGSTDDVESVVTALLAFGADREFGRLDHGAHGERHQGRVPDAPVPGHGRSAAGTSASAAGGLGSATTLDGGAGPQGASVGWRPAHRRDATVATGRVGRGPGGTAGPAATEPPAGEAVVADLAVVLRTMREWTPPGTQATLGSLWVVSGRRLPRRLSKIRTAGRRVSGGTP